MKKCLWLFFIFFVSVQAKAEKFQIIQDGPVHEAYVIQEYGTLFLETVSNEPPHTISEVTPKQDDLQSIWIPGYWAWSTQYGQFLWVSGVWRRAPKDHHWISGYWKKLSDGWVWIRGFWSKIQEKEIVYIANPPPDPIDEEIPELPSSIGDYFWVRGCWQYNYKTKEYDWYKGRWILPLPHWIYVPPHSLWREKGYVFVPAFWDWPLDDRGFAYASVYVPTEIIDAFTYEPVNVLPYLFILQHLFPYWPNYQCLFHYSYYFHKDAWTAWGAAPPWWNWPTWWCYTWHDTWWLWWWWSHNGYPNPFWIDQALADSIQPPPPFVEKMMAKIQPPPIVTANGVVSTQNFFNALESFKGNKTPLLPADIKKLKQLQAIANPNAPKAPYLTPRGEQQPVAAPKKIFFGPSSFDTTSEQVILPPIPTLSPQMQQKDQGQESKKSVTQLLDSYDDFLAQFESPAGPLTPEEEMEEALRMVESQPPQKKQPEPLKMGPRAPQTQLPTHTPRSRYPGLHWTGKPERPIPQPTQRRRFLPHEPSAEELVPYPESPVPPLHMAPETEYEMQSPYENSVQGYTLPSRRRQLTPMQTEHHDLFMTHPHPQVNPEGPKVHQVPGDYSTLPEQ